MFNNGDLVVVKQGPERGRIGTYEYRGPQYQTVFLRQGCSVLMIEPGDLEHYSEYRHGRLAF